MPPTLSSRVYEKCQQILMKCDSFHSMKSLELLFLEDLAQYKDYIPEAKTRLERVNVTISFLVEKAPIAGLPPFTLFLSILRNKYPKEDELYKELDELKKIVTLELSPEVTVPFVVVAMTKVQATMLINRKLSSKWSTQSEIEAFDNLQIENTRDLISHYGDSPEDWKPDINYDETIASIVTEAITDYNDLPENYRSRPLVPEFHSLDFFSEDESTRHATWNKLGWSGCVLIVDTVSIYHPLIYRRLLESEMGANERIAIAVATISPSLNQPKLIRKLDDGFKTRMQRAFIRAHWYEELLCTNSINSRDHLTRWIKYGALKEISEVVATQKIKRRPKNKSKQRMQLIPAPGFQQAIFGHGVKG